MNGSNCKAAITCGCQKRKASDGKEVCSSCLSFYEKSLITSSKTNKKPNT